MTIYELIEGSTRKIVIPILEDGNTFNGTGFTLADVLLTGIDGVAVDTAGDFGWENQSTGRFYLNPDSTDFVAGRSPYRIRAKLVDGTGAIGYAPQGAAAEIIVRPPRY